MNARSLSLVALSFGPTAAMVDLSLSYALVGRTQATGTKMSLFVVTAVAALITVLGIVLAQRVLARKSEAAAVDRFLAVAGIALNAYFLLVILGFAVPKAIHGPWD